MEIGNASYGGQSNNTRKEFFKIKDGDQVYRILPPLGSQAKTGRWSRYLRVEWGYKDSNQKHKPFLDIREVNRKSGMVEVESEAHIKREEIKAQVASAKLALKAGKITQDQMNQLNKIAMNFSLESKHYMNAVDRNGKIGILKIGHKLKLAMDAEIDKLRATGVDPLSVENGRFFVISRSGRGLDTTYGISVLTEKIMTQEFGEVQKQIVHKLDSSILERLSTEAMDLSDLDKMYPSFSEDEVKRIVRGTPADVTAVFENLKNANAASSNESEDGPEAEEYSQVAAPVNTAPAQEQVVSQPLSQAVGSTQNVSAPVTETKAANPVQLSDDDFLAGLASLGIKS